MRSISFHDRIHGFPVAIVFTWTMVFLAMCVYAVAWFLLGSVTMQIIEAMSSAFTFDAPWDSIVEFCRQVVLWHPVISLVGWIIWGFLNSMRRPVRTWEYQ